MTIRKRFKDSHMQAIYADCLKHGRREGQSGLATAYFRGLNAMPAPPRNWQTYAAWAAGRDWRKHLIKQDKSGLVALKQLMPIFTGREQAR